MKQKKPLESKLHLLSNDSIITSPQVNAKIESGAFVITSSSDKKLPQLYKQIIENKLYSCGITYRNGYILNKKGEIIGNYSNGYIYDTKNDIKYYYSNGYIYDSNRNIIGNYNNGFVKFKTTKQ